MKCETEGSCDVLKLKGEVYDLIRQRERLVAGVQQVDALIAERAKTVEQMEAEKKQAVEQVTK